MFAEFLSEKPDAIDNFFEFFADELTLRNRRSRIKGQYVVEPQFKR